MIWLAFCEASTPPSARVAYVAVRSTAACTGSRSPADFVSFISFSLSFCRTVTTRSCGHLGSLLPQPIAALAG